MENYNKRLGARFVGIADGILTVAGMLTFIIFTVHHWDILFRADAVMSSIICVGFVFLLAVFQAAKGYALFYATEKGRDPARSFKVCCGWLITIIVLTILWTVAAIWKILGINWIILTVIFILNVIFSLVVITFMVELKSYEGSALKASENAGADLSESDSSAADPLNGV